MMFSEEQIRDIVTLKEKLTRKISDHQEAIDSLEKNLRILDTVLKESSFTRASQMAPRTDGAPKDAPEDIPEDAPEDIPEDAPEDIPEDAPEDIPEDSVQDDDSIPIKRGNGGDLIARARITQDRLSITLEDHIRVREDTPPFRSFFMDRIIGDIRRKDEAMAKRGDILPESVIECTVDSDKTGIREIVIRNYGGDDRTGDLINAAEWSLTRMLEKTGK